MHLHHESFVELEQSVFNFVKARSLVNKIRSDVARKSEGKTNEVILEAL